MNELCLRASVTAFHHKYTIVMQQQDLLLVVFSQDRAIYFQSIVAMVLICQFYVQMQRAVSSYIDMTCYEVN